MAKTNAAGDNVFAHIREQTDFAGKVVCLSRQGAEPSSAAFFFLFWIRR
ncbi:hypothetical protein [Variovorax rhizosphaerae]|uniref:Uncharacterized protein n=1 Tax=Variovorax rhizosphaerae TaxID=1836200 RepID=A0ABU8WRK2_9BURK